MKWIGQHIWSLISRFRSDVYLENLGTSSETNILVVDSDGKITKNTGAGDDMTFQLEDGTGTEVTISDGKEVKIVDGTGIAARWTDTDNGTDADPYDLTITVDVSDFMTNGSDNRVVTATGADAMNAEADLTYDSETLTIGADDNGNATIKRLNHSDGVGGTLSLQGGSVTDGGAANTTGGHLSLAAGTGTGSGTSGDIRFMGHAAGSSGSDEGTNVVTAVLDGSGNLQIDGGLTVGSTSFVNSSGVVQVATQGTIDHDSLANFVANEHIDWTGASAGTIHATNYTNTTYSEATSSDAGLMSTAHHDKLDGIEASATADQTQADINGLAITTVGTISSGTWQGTAVASAYLDADTAHLSTTQTFTGRKTINSRMFAVTGTTHGEAIGDIIFIGGTTSMTAGKVYYLRTNGGWAEADADTTTTSTSLIAVALGTASDTHGMLLRGMVTLSEDIGGTEDEGIPLYLSTTAGAVTATAPSSSSNVVRVVGYSMCAPSSPATGYGEDNQIWFNPDNTWVEIA